ncbi:MAG: hypothetical protein RLZZ382_1538 [Bacteroidota bacterium]|jgi:hypothetical protein
MKNILLFLVVTLSSVCFSQTLVFDSVMVGNIVDDSTVVWDSTYTQKSTSIDITDSSVVIDSQNFNFVNREKSNSDDIFTYTAVNPVDNEKILITHFIDDNGKLTLILDRGGKSFYFNK